MEQRRIVCAGCKYSAGDNGWADYVCPKCGALHVGLYRREHRDAKRAAGMSLLEIAWECRQAGMRVRFAPGAQ